MADTRCQKCGGMKSYPRVIEIDDKMQECKDPFHSEEKNAVIDFKTHSAVTRPPKAPDLGPPPQPDAICPHADCDASPIEIFFNEFKFPDGRTAFLFYCTKCLRLVPAALQPVVIGPRVPPPPK